MMFRPRAAACALAITVGLGIGAPIPSASAQSVGAPAAIPTAAVPSSVGLFAGIPFGGLGAGVNSAAGPCGISVGPQGQAGTGGTSYQNCLGAGLVFNGPSIGQVASVIGPTIIGPGVAATVVVSAGNGVAGP
jgi:hypothetical protein